MNQVDKIERRIEQLHLSTGAATDKRILTDAFVTLSRGLKEERLGIWRTIAMSRVTRPVAAAAVILIAVGFLLTLLDGNVDTIDDFYETLDGVRNACATSFKPGQTDPFQQVWTSQSLKVRLFKTGVGEKAQFALWDIDSKSKMMLYLSTVETQPLTEEELTAMEKSISLSATLTPFSDMKDVPMSARWTRVIDPAVVAVIPGSAVYDLVWIQPVATSEKGAHKKLRVFVDAGTHLPRRVESYGKSEPEQQYTLESFIIVTYPSEDEIKDIVASTFGSPGTRGDGPEYIGTPGTDR